jgi:hypothetical protein
VTTAIAVYNSEGVVGRCDAKCHNAQSPECDCICGGRLHGVGADRAVAENTRQHFGAESLEDALVDFAKRNGLSRVDLRAEVLDVQAGLF